MIPLLSASLYWFTCHYACLMAQKNSLYVDKISRGWKQSTFTIIQALNQQFPSDISKVILSYADIDHTRILYEIEYNIRSYYYAKFTKYHKMAYYAFYVRISCIVLCCLVIIHIIVLDIVDIVIDEKFNKFRNHWYIYIFLFLMNPCIKQTWISCVLLKFNKMYFKLSNDYKDENQTAGNNIFTSNHYGLFYSILFGRATIKHPNSKLNVNVTNSNKNRNKIAWLSDDRVCFIQDNSDKIYDIFDTITPELFERNFEDDHGIDDGDDKKNISSNEKYNAVAFKKDIKAIERMQNQMENEKHSGGIDDEDVNESKKNKENDRQTDENWASFDDIPKQTFVDPFSDDNKYDSDVDPFAENGDDGNDDDQDSEFGLKNEQNDAEEEEKDKAMWSEYDNHDTYNDRKSVATVYGDSVSLNNAAIKILLSVQQIISVYYPNKYYFSQIDEVLNPATNRTQTRNTPLKQSIKQLLTKIVYADLILTLIAITPMFLLFIIPGAFIFMPSVIIIGLVAFFSVFLIQCIENKIDNNFKPFEKKVDGLIEQLNIEESMSVSGNGEYNLKLDEYCNENKIKIFGFDKCICGIEIKIEITYNYIYLILSLCQLFKIYCLLFWIFIAMIICGLSMLCFGFEKNQFDWGYCFVYGWSFEESMLQLFDQLEYFGSFWTIILLVVSWIIV